MDLYTARLYERFRHMLCDEQLLPTSQTPIGIFDGWEKVLEHFLYAVERRVLHEIGGPSETDYPVFAQIKQKFGGLRIYLAQAGSVPIDDLIEEAADEAKRTCYKCGRSASLSMVDGVAAPRCPECLHLDQSRGES